MEYQEFAHAKKYTDIHKKLIDRKAIEARKHSLAFLQSTLDATDDGIIIVDREQKICHYNYKFIQMWKISEGTLAPKSQRNVLTLMLKQLKNPEAYIGKEMQLYVQPEIESYDVFELKDERMFERYSKPQWLEGEIVGRVLSFRDITEQKRMEKEMSHLERMNVIGEMAAGIGHEVRNPLTTIRGFLQMLIHKKDCSQYQEYYNLMIEELDRANSIITEFLSLTKGNLIGQEPKNMNVIINSLLPLIEADAIIANKYVRVELSEIPKILVDDKEIRQLILNLVRNSLDAMDQGGYLTIRTYIEGEKIVLAIKDQGTGIAPEVLKNIGKPFFTTKEQGTGLGLAICYSIVEHHHATINVESSDKGTTFFIKFNQLKGATISTD